MTGIENYRRAIEFKKPDTVPCDIGVDLDWMQEKDPKKRARIRELIAQFPDDLLRWLNTARNAVEPESQDGVVRWTDEWQTGWVDDGYGAKTDRHPLIDGYEAFPGSIIPDPHVAGRFSAVDEILQNRKERYVQAAVWFTLFERLWMLRGFENMLMDPYVNERSFCMLRDQIVDYDLAIIDAWLARRANGIFFSDDWGSQKGLLIHPDDWRKFYKPSYKRLFDRVRSGGAHVWMHLCGNITAILPDLIDIGLNVLNPVQPQAMDLQVLSREFGGSLCFYGGIDVQGTLIHGSTEEVKQQVRDLIELFGRFDGGYIGGTSHSIMPETPLDNIIAMYETFLECR
ncbi:MAG TPA: uroporphyrinogen decarboxylase family protein [bacterium]|nr:uroporphyrinogen decarboxylase family protein [bacterium]